MQTVIKERKSGCINIRQSRLQNKENYQEKGGTLHSNKWVIHLEDIISNMYAPNNWASEYMDQTLTEPEEETDKPKAVAGDFNTSFSVTDRTSRPKKQANNKDIEELNITNQLDLTFIQYSTQQSKIDILLKHTWNIHQQNSISWIKNILTNLKDLKSHKLCSLTIMEWN